MAIPIYEKITNFFLGSATGKLDANFSKTAEEFSKVIYRDGSSFMQGVLDMNSQRIINIPAPVDENDAANLASVRGLVSTIRKGDPGGNVMSVGLFASLPSLLIPSGTNLIQTSDISRGVLVEDTSLTDANVSAHPSAIVKTANGRYFRRDPRYLCVEQFGAKGDGLTDDTAAIRAAIAYADFSGRVDIQYSASAYQKGTPTVTFGVGVFLVSASFNLYQTVRLVGQGNGMEGGGGGTFIKQMANAHVFIVNRANTANFEASSGNGGADGSEICNMAIRYASTGGTRGFNGASAVAAHARINLHDCIIEGFPGPGWQIRATNGAGGFAEGEASCASIRRVVCNANFCGAYLTGGDANVIEVSSCTFGGNDTWGIFAEQFLCCTFINCHFKSNGQNGTVAQNTVVYNGKRYAVMPNMEGLASTTAPGTNPQVWQYIDDFTTNIRTWVSGGAYVGSGSVAHINRNARSTFVSCYHESGQGAPVIFFPAMSVGGQWIHAQGSDGVHITGEQGELRARGLRASLPSVTSSSALAADTGLEVFNGTKPMYIGPRGTGWRWGIFQGDGDTAMYMRGVNTPGKVDVGFIELRRVIAAGPYADNATAIANGLVTGAIYSLPDGTIKAVV